jgi:hypothetical protein
LNPIGPKKGTALQRMTTTKRPISFAQIMAEQACATEPAVAKPTDAEPAVAEPIDAEPADAEPTDAEPADAEPADAEPADAEPTDAEPTDAEPTDADSTDEEYDDSDDSGEYPGSLPDVGSIQVLVQQGYVWNLEATIGSMFCADQARQADHAALQGDHAALQAELDAVRRELDAAEHQLNIARTETLNLEEELQAHRTMTPAAHAALSTPGLCKACASHKNVEGSNVVCEHCVFKVQQYHARCVNIACSRVKLPFVWQNGEIARFCCNCVETKFVCTKKACSRERLPSQRTCATCKASK